MSSFWRKIDEDNQPPLDTDVILGWWQKWPMEGWCMKIAFFGSKRARWRDGDATHWIPLDYLPPAPTQAQKAAK